MTLKERLVTVSEGTTREEAMALLHRYRLERVLVVNSDFELRGLITVKDIIKTSEHPNACKDDLGRLRVGAASASAKAATNGQKHSPKQAWMSSWWIRPMVIPRVCLIESSG